MKMNDETDAAYIVRMLRDSYNVALAQENAARVKQQAAFEALNVAERAKDYLDHLAKKKAEANDAR